MTCTIQPKEEVKFLSNGQLRRWHIHFLTQLMLLTFWYSWIFIFRHYSTRSIHLTVMYGAMAWFSLRYGPLGSDHFPVQVIVKCSRWYKLASVKSHPQDALGPCINSWWIAGEKICRPTIFYIFFNTRHKAKKDKTTLPCMLLIKLVWCDNFFLLRLENHVPN